MKTLFEISRGDFVAWCDRVYKECAASLARGSPGWFKKGPFRYTRTWIFTDVKQQYTPVWRFRKCGSALCWVSTWFSMLVEEWGFYRPPLLQVFHRGKSSDTHSFQRVCRLCLWRRNAVPSFTTIRLIDRADFKRFREVMCCCQGNCLSRKTEGFGSEYFFAVCFRLPRVSPSDEWLSLFHPFFVTLKNVFCFGLFASVCCKTSVRRNNQATAL